MEYSLEVVEAARVVLGALSAGTGGDVLIPADLVAEVQIIERGEIASLSLAMTKADKKNPTPADLMGLWNSLKDDRLAACIKLTAARRRQCLARLREFPKKEDWVAFMKCINSTDWMLGKGPANSSHAGWRANFDWFTKPDSIVKFLEGRYKQVDVPVSAREGYGGELDQRNNEERPHG